MNPDAEHSNRQCPDCGWPCSNPDHTCEHHVGYSAMCPYCEAEWSVVDGVEKYLAAPPGH